MTRVLNIISDINIGGAGRVILNYLRCADRDRFEILTAVPRGSLLKGPLEEAGGAVCEVDAAAARSYDRRDVKVLEALIRQRKPDLVHTHGCFSGRIAAKHCGVPVVYTRHSPFPIPAYLRYPPGRWVNKWVNQRYADRIIAVSPFARDNLVQGGVPPEKITVVINGVVPIPVPTPEQRQRARAAFGFGPGDFVAGILARVTEYKGHRTALEALEPLIAQGRPVRLLIAGEGDCLEEVRRRASALPEGSVVLAGFVREVERVLWAMDVQVNASYKSEGTSLSLLEGMSVGLPSVVTDCGGNPYLVQHGDNGLVFPRQDSRALSQAIGRLMDAPEERERMGRRAREIFQARFTAQAFARETENVYSSVLKGA